MKFELVNPDDEKSIEIISDWYYSEWKIPKEKTIANLKSRTSNSQFQVLMTLNGVPISTGGLYNHIGLLDKVPRLNIFKNWLALVYTIPDMRHKGYGALLCDHISSNSKKIGINEIYLFTDTAEKLYIRLGWHVIERLTIDDRNIAVMKKDV